MKALIAAGLLAASLATAAAQSYPARPVTMVVPYPPGGPTDAVARILAEGMRAALRQPVIIDNVAGASGSIGTGRVARAASDGYTIVFGNWGSHVVNAAVYALPYDVVGDFAPVALVANQPLLIVGRKTLPATSLAQLIAWLKANPGATAGGAGAGSANHIASVFFEKETGTRLQFVPYRGGAIAMQDLLAGQIDLIFDLAASALPQVRAGTVKAFAAMAARRPAAASDIPTVDEAGLPGLHVSLWSAVWAPRQTPAAAIAALNGAVTASLGNAGVRRRLADLGQELPPRDQQTPEALAALQQGEIAKWWPIVRAANIKVE